VVGYMGMPRRYHYYYFAPEFQVYNILSTAGASVLAIGFALPVFYLTSSIRKGVKAGANPWGAHGLEWEIPSPPPTTNFDRIPIVTDDVYDYESDARRANIEMIESRTPEQLASTKETH
jgi:cytochrome c oxidase subunit 1